MFKSYKYKTELHAHTTPASGCSDIPNNMMAGIYKNNGFSAICLTNHFIPSDTNLSKYDFIEFYCNDFEICKKAGKELGINVIFGVEYRLAENANDYLIFGIDKNDLEELFERKENTIETFYNAFKSKKRVIIQAHPMRNGVTPTDFADGYEVYNMHPHHNQRTSLAAKFTEGKDKIITAGSDFHHFGTEAMIATLTKELPEDSFHLAQILKTKDYIFKTGDGIIVPHPEAIIL
ncbi:MAG: PHP domain-containing protein [Clostridia bacterium]|nr:PHP domain-containing protein [Clostridia bacterium]